MLHEQQQRLLMMLLAINIIGLCIFLRALFVMNQKLETVQRILYVIKAEDVDQIKQAVEGLKNLVLKMSVFSSDKASKFINKLILTYFFREEEGWL